MKQYKIIPYRRAVKLFREGDSIVRLRLNGAIIPIDDVNKISRRRLMARLRD